MSVQLAAGGSCKIVDHLGHMVIGAVAGAAAMWYLRESYKINLTLDSAIAPTSQAAAADAQVEKVANAAIAAAAPAPAPAPADEGFVMQKGGGGTGPINIVETIRRERRHAIPGHPGVYYNRPRVAPLTSTGALSATRTARSSIDTNTDVAFLRFAKQARRGRRMPVVAGAQF